MCKDVFYVFKCGCKAEKYVGHEIMLGGKKRTSRYCPDCYEPERSPNSKCNRSCILVGLESSCYVCGTKATLSKNTNIRNSILFLCKEHQHLRVQISKESFQDRMANNPAIMNLNGPKKSLKDTSLLAICPKCRRKHPVSNKLKFATKTPWKYCIDCEYYLATDGDNDCYSIEILKKANNSNY